MFNNAIIVVLIMKIEQFTNALDEMDIEVFCKQDQLRAVHLVQNRPCVLSCPKLCVHFK